MSRFVPESELPQELLFSQALEICYSSQIETVRESVQRGIPTLIQCEKGMTGFLFSVLRARLRDQFLCHYIDGRMPPPGGMPGTVTSNILATLTHLIRSGSEDSNGKRNVLVLPHLDLLTTTNGAMTTEAREAIALLYENPNIIFLGFRDPSMVLPKTIMDAFGRNVDVSSIPRQALPKIVTQKESRKLGSEKRLDVYKLYKHVSGLTALRIRQVLSSIEGEDYPKNSKPVWDWIRSSTIEGNMSIPEIDLDKDLGGYQPVKTKLKDDILSLLSQLDGCSDEEKYAKIESLIPRGMIFWGPPGTGKTLFAKALASSLGAAVQIVNGPELKSKWVGESEENLRRVFTQARQSAPSLIVFDEMDSFASQRGTYTGSGVEHSMVNQLLTEMDGFRSNELVFVIGTTNFVESLDSALLRPGRFEFHLHIPYPDEGDREAILRIYDKKFGLCMTEEALKHAVAGSAYPIGRGMWSGDHLEALCRSIARNRLRKNRDDQTTVDDVELAFSGMKEKPVLNADERRVVAIHECGHAIVGMNCKHLPPIKRISIGGNLTGALGVTEHQEDRNKHVVNFDNLLDRMVVCMGGTVAEEMVLGVRSLGAGHDLAVAKNLARILVQNGYPKMGLAHDSRETLSPEMARKVDEEIEALLLKAEGEAKSILMDKRPELDALVKELLEKGLIEVK